MAALQHFVNVFDRKNCYLLDYKVLSGMFNWVYGFLSDTGAIGCTVTAHRLTTRPYTDFSTTFQSGPTPRRGHRFYRKNRDQVLPRWRLSKHSWKQRSSIQKATQHAFLIPRLHKTKKGHRASKTKGISYTRMNEIFHEKIHTHHTENKNLGLHSSRAIGASDRLISKHER